MNGSKINNTLAQAAIASDAQMRLMRKPRSAAKRGAAVAAFSLGLVAILGLPLNLDHKSPPAQLMLSLQHNGG